MNRLTKVYKNGKVTLDASAFPGELQETLDSDVRTAGKPIRAAVERLAELEDIGLTPREIRQINNFYKTIKIMMQ